MTGVTKITVTDGVSLVTFPHFPARLEASALLLEQLAQAGIILDMISRSVPLSDMVSFSFTIADRDLVPTLKVANAFSRSHSMTGPIVSSNNSKIQLFGSEMPQLYGVAARGMQAVADSGVELLLVTTSELDISFLVPSARVQECLQHLQDAP